MNTHSVSKPMEKDPLALHVLPGEKGFERMLIMRHSWIVFIAGFALGHVPPMCKLVMKTTALGVVFTFGAL